MRHIMFIIKHQFYLFLTYVNARLLRTVYMCYKKIERQIQAAAIVRFTAFAQSGKTGGRLFVPIFNTPE